MEKENKLKPGEIVDLETVPAVVWLPEESVEATITVKVYADGELHEVETKMNMKDLKSAMSDGDDWADTYVKYALTDKGRELSTQIEAEEDTAYTHGEK